MAPRYNRDNAKESEILQVCHHIIAENDAYFQWIESVLEEKIPTQDFEVVLKDGTILCRLMNKIQPGSIKKFRETVIFPSTVQTHLFLFRELPSCSWRISRPSSVPPGSMESPPRSCFRPQTCLRGETSPRLCSVSTPWAD